MIQAYLGHDDIRAAGFVTASLEGVAIQSLHSYTMYLLWLLSFQAAVSLALSIGASDGGRARIEEVGAVSSLHHTIEKRSEMGNREPPRLDIFQEQRYREIWFSRTREERQAYTRCTATLVRAPLIVLCATDIN